MLILLNTSCNSSGSEKKQNLELDDQNALIFPEDWLGYWEGELSIYNQKGLSQKIPMALDHKSTDTLGTYGWAIIYGEDVEAGRRDYYLKEIDKDKGHYVTDEKNGILLDAFLLNNRLSSTFEVEGTLITSSYIREGDNMIFEIYVGDTNNPKVTGDTLDIDDEIPVVNSFLSTGYHKAILRKKIPCQNKISTRQRNYRHPMTVL